MTMREPSSVRQRSTARAIWLAGALAAALPGCLAQPGGDEEIGVALEALNDNSHAAFDYFLAKGLTPVQAAGIVGNLMQESSCNPNAVQPGGPGRGIAQWSVGGRWDRSTNDNAVAYAASRRASVWSLGLQLDFIWYELTTFSGYGLARLRAATTVSAAVTAFQNRYEICGTCVQTQRLAYANQALAAYGGDAASAWGARFVSQTFPVCGGGGGRDRGRAHRVGLDHDAQHREHARGTRARASRPPRPATDAAPSRAQSGARPTVQRASLQEPPSRAAPTTPSPG